MGLWKCDEYNDYKMNIQTKRKQEKQNDWLCNTSHKERSRKVLGKFWKLVYITNNTQGTRNKGLPWWEVTGRATKQGLQWSVFNEGLQWRSSMKCLQWRSSMKVFIQQYEELHMKVFTQQYEELHMKIFTQQYWRHSTNILWTQKEALHKIRSTSQTQNINYKIWMYELPQHTP